MKELQTDSVNSLPQKWQAAEKAAWFKKQKIQRSYQHDVTNRLTDLPEYFIVEQYGELCYPPHKYPLYTVKPRIWDANKATILITGGVHGYETSGVLGALSFIEKYSRQYAQRFNIVVAPCVSPWGYETINRWNADTVDPNRSFYQPSPAQEAALLMDYVEKLDADFIAHIDLHETTDTDNTEFRPALAARDAKVQPLWAIPDGFYLVGDEENSKPDFQRAIIDSVKKVTHIAPADSNGKIIGEPISQHGVINYAAKKLGLCCAFSNALYSTTTEVYPDSPKVTAEECIHAQVAAITGGLDYLINNNLV
ncbi:M14 family metallocarboxypeptidase [Psychromonas sp.]|uniref:M14 family metallopeptidase n=1 Tax=Psychromonas sp. TaxID=1884585 RepID=UPI003566D352